MSNQTFHNKISLSVLVLCTCVTALTVWYANNLNFENWQTRFATDASEFRAELRTRVNVIAYGLGGANGVFAASKSVEHNEWRRYVQSRNLPVEFPGVLGFGFISYVKRSDIHKFTEDTRADEQPNFTVKTTGDHSDLFVIKYIEPVAQNDKAVGFDIGQEPIRRHAAEMAMLTGIPTLTRRIALVQLDAHDPGFLFLRPVYRNDSSHNTPAERRESIEGWVYAPFSLKNVISPLMKRYSQFSSIRVFEEGLNGGPQDLIFASGNEAPNSTPILTDTIEIGQQRWSVSIGPEVAFYHSHFSKYNCYLLGLAGLFGSILLSGIVWIYLSRRYLSFQSELSNRDTIIHEILDNANVSIILGDLNGVITVFNKAASRMLGYSPEEMIGKVTPEIIHDKEEVVAEAHKLSQEFHREIEPGFEVFVAECRNKTGVEKEWTYIRKDGSRFPVLLSVTAIRNDKGNITGYMGIASDLSERKRAEQTIRLATSAGKVGVWVWSVHENKLSWDDSMLEIYGVDKRNFRGAYEVWSEALTLEDRKRAEDELAIALKGGKPFDTIFTIKRPDGGVRYIQAAAVVERSIDGDVISMIGTNVDITEVINREEKLRRSEELFKASFWNAPNGFALLGLDGTWQTVNPTLCRMLGYNDTELVGKNCSEMTHADDLPADAERSERLLRGEIETYTIEKRYIKKNGELLWVLRSVSLIHDKDGTPAFFLSHIQDIEEAKIQADTLKKKSTELYEAQEQALNASKAKGEFLANMSHEIRTPLTSIIGYSEALLHDELTKDESRIALETVIRNGNHLLGVINDILDLSKIEAGKLEIQHMPCILPEIVSDVANLMRHKAQEKGLSLGFDYLFPIPRLVQTDPLRLKQILINLVGNAVKFTSAGGVKINVIYRQDENSVQFDIIDTGPGIAPGHLEKLFKAFSQADMSITRNFGGTGLGLVISEMLAKKLGGGITVTSEVGRGSVFSVKISTGAVNERDLIMSVNSRDARVSQTNSAILPTFSGQVLVAEDGEDNRDYLSFLLRRLGVNFKIVENGALAIEEIRNISFDLILMDMQMPVMDGLTATKAIREAGFTVPIVALTANAMKEDIDLALSSGFTNFLGKPFARDRFISMLSLYLKSDKSEEKVANSPLSQNTIDLLEESPEMRDLILNTIQKLPKRLSEISEALDSNDMSRASMVSHSERGALGNVGFESLSNLFGEIEDAANHNDVMSARTALSRLASAISERKEMEDALARWRQ